MGEMLKAILIPLILILFISSHGMTLHAQVAQEIDTESIAVSLVIDTSGSMDNTDPDQLRETASNIFIDLLSPDDYLGIITFNNTATVVQEMKQVEGYENKDEFKTNLSSYLDASSSEGGTDYKAALEEASTQLSGFNDNNVRKVIIFITDGKPALSGSSNDDTSLMDDYMTSLWEVIDQLASQEFPVYSIGFSDGVREDVLEKIASDTGGDFKILSDSGALAGSIFETLDSLKSRTEILNQSLDLTEDSSITFNMDEYTSQTTVVAVNEQGGAYEIKLTSPDGMVYQESAESDGIVINKMDKYAIITITSIDTSLYGSWKVDFSGEGTLNILGDKDLSMKSSLISPVSTSKYPLNEPVEISVNVTGEVQEGISVKAKITDPKGNVSDDIVLDKEDGVFSGEYDETDIAGIYSAKISILLDDQVISTIKEDFNVQNIPVLSCDFSANESGYRVGEFIKISSSLLIDDSSLVEGKTLKIDNFTLVFTNDDQTTEEVELLDNGDSESGDMVSGDGIWSCKAELTKEMISKVKLVVSGTYKDEDFVLEQDFGTIEVKEAGSITITQNGSQDLLGVLGKVVSIPITVENNSEFAETVKVKLSSDIGSLVENKIELEPGEKKDVNVEILLDTDNKEDVKNTTQKVTLLFEADNSTTELSQDELSWNINVVSAFVGMVKPVTDSIISAILNFGLISWMIISGIIILIIIFIVGGIVNYRRFYVHALIINGKLEYQLKDNNRSLDHSINLFNAGKSRVVISFDDTNEDADFKIRNVDYNYNIIISSEMKKINHKIIEGWKALYFKDIPVTYNIKVTVPGIIMNKGVVVSSMRLENEEEFETGGYIFRYTVNDERMQNEKGRNILEVVYEEG